MAIAQLCNQLCSINEYRIYLSWNRPIKKNYNNNNGSGSSDGNDNSCHSQNIIGCRISPKTHFIYKCSTLSFSHSLNWITQFGVFYELESFKRSFFAFISLINFISERLRDVIKFEWIDGKLIPSKTERCLKHRNDSIRKYRLAMYATCCVMCLYVPCHGSHQYITHNMYLIFYLLDFWSRWIHFLLATGVRQVMLS